MATLFFDGFDRGTTLKRLDPNYWSLQYAGYPKYAFGGTPRVRNNFAYTKSYEYSSPNNGFLPIISDAYEYPGFGNFSSYAPGFLALSNIPIDDEYNEQPITYLQLSGIPQSSGTKLYFGMRCLGIETKHEDYWNEAIPLGRFGYKHPLIAFCSGNTTGLLLNIISVTGDNLLPLVTNDPPNNQGKKITIGLEVEQNNGISGIFDLNVSDTASRYRITPYYCGGSTAANIPINSTYKSLIIADTATYFRGGSVINRWTHFEIEIDNSNNNSGFLKLKIEGVDSLVIDNNLDREYWDIKIPINKFNFNNIRLYNRTYVSNTINACTSYDSSNKLTASGAYYGCGSMTLYDDITLVDNTGNDPTYYLGPDAKVISLYPGYPPEGQNLNPLIDGYGAPDGLKQWSVAGVQHHRAALLTNDNDTTHISSYTKNSINAIRYSNLDKDSSNWRLRYNDGIGGIKIYSNARKGFLDTSYTTVGFTKPSDEYADNVLLLVHADDAPVIDFSSFFRPIELNNANLSDDRKFGTSGLLYSGDNSYMVVKDPIDFTLVPFTIESWIKFSGNSGITILDRQYNSNLSNYPLDGAIDSTTDPGYKIVCTTGYMDIIRYYYCSTLSYSTCTPTFSTNPAVLRLPFPSAVPTGVWNHIALVRNTGVSSGWFTAYLNGNSGTGYFRINMPILSPVCILTSSPYSCTGAVTDTIMSGGAPFYRKDGPGGDPIFGFSTDVGAGFAKLFYSLTSTYKKNNNTYPAMPYIYIGQSGFMDEYRITSGIARYTNNFIPPSAVFRSVPEDYFQMGPNIELDRTSYKLTQFYQMYNPSTSLSWSSGDIMTSGIILGVKKT